MEKEMYILKKQIEIKEKHKNIKNKNYRQFLDEGVISTLSEDDLYTVLDNIKTKWLHEARALVIIAYYTGARPNEYLRLKARDVKREGNYITVIVPGSKNGLTRKLHLPYKKDLVKEFWHYVEGVFLDMFLFYHFKGNYKRIRKGKTGRISERKEIAYKLRYHFDRWFSVLDIGSVPPYYLRHNRFSKLAEQDASLQDLRMWKGCKTETSIIPYLHMSSFKSKKMAGKLD